ncbi:MAG: peptidase [Alphaproteobacteria bacterium]|jgi:nucleoid-associated protein YgaU|nr:peptidase [Alphaproteobacteria bacterium]
MSLLSFIKEAGAALFGGRRDAKEITAEDLKKTVAEHGFSVEGLQISLDGDKATVSGKAKSTEEAEKIALTIGNIAGIAAVDNKLTVEKEAPQATMYTVKKGDTLWAIAEAHYGKGQGAKYTEIVKANTPPIKNPDLIQPGWVLRIPPLK